MSQPVHRQQFSSVLMLAEFVSPTVFKFVLVKEDSWLETDRNPFIPFGAHGFRGPIGGFLVIPYRGVIIVRDKG